MCRLMPIMITLSKARRSWKLLSHLPLFLVCFYPRLLISKSINSVQSRLAWLCSLHPGEKRYVREYQGHHSELIWLTNYNLIDQMQKVRDRQLVAPADGEYLQPLVINELKTKKHTATEGLLWLVRFAYLIQSLTVPGTHSL